MVEGVPGSSPDWRGANMKTKGRAPPSASPPVSLLGQSTTGLAEWGTGMTDVPKSRRHFHQSQLSQTTAWDCLPCVDAAQVPPTAVAAKKFHSSSNTSTLTSTSQPEASAASDSMSLALANREWRRHRREVPAPPCHDKPQGKRMLHNTAPPFSCKELLQDPQPPAQRTATTAPAPSAAAASGPPAFQHSPSKTQPACSHDSLQNSSSSLDSSRGSSSYVGAVKQGSRSLSSSRAAPWADQSDLGATTGAAATATGSPGGPGSKAGGKKAGRVEDDPNYFRTPKDPPTLLRFAESLAQVSLGKGGALSTAQRHEAGIRARQQASIAAAAREVEALDASCRHDND